MITVLACYSNIMHVIKAQKSRGSIPLSPHLYKVEFSGPNLSRLILKLVCG